MMFFDCPDSGRRPRLAAAAALSALLGFSILSGCASDAQTGTLIGGGTGAAAGAIIGHQSGHTGEGAAIGAAGGALIGYLFGNESDKSKARKSSNYNY